MKPSWIIRGTGLKLIWFKGAICWLLGHRWKNQYRDLRLAGHRCARCGATTGLWESDIRGFLHVGTRAWPAGSWEPEKGL